MKEKAIENKIKNYLKSIGAYYFKHHGGQYSKVGVPDLIACYRGYFIGIEVKQAKGRISPLQEINLKEINDNGGIGIIARDLETVIETIESLDK